MACQRTDQLSYAWDADSVDDIVLLINRIYAPVMGGEVTLKAAIADVLATSDKKADLVVSPWPDIVKASRSWSPSTTASPRKRSRPATSIAERGPAAPGGAMQPHGGADGKVLTHQGVNQKLARSTGRLSSLGSRCRGHGWSAA